MKRLLFTSALYPCMLAAGIAVSLSARDAAANPLGGQVSAGQANIHSSGPALTVEQHTGRAVIDWQSFNIAPGETTIFHQPSASSTILNRIHDEDPSKILGTLTANATVALVNPNGMIFGRGSKVDVGSLIATSADIRSDDFMAGRMNFALPGKPDASVVNAGQITARDAGLVELVAPSVTNGGTITARLGKVALASGDTMTLDLYGDGLVSVAVSGDIGSQLVENSGHIAAEGGTVALTAAAAREVVDSLIVNTGVIAATALGDQQGTITLSAEGSNAVAGNVAAEKGEKQGSSTVLVQGVLDASGRNPGERGGTITVTGDQVGILSGALLDASGDHGGGTLHLGGQRQGQGSTPASGATYVDAHSLMLNDALTQGDGGETIVWSDGDTVFHGTISGRGGARGGDGGFAETSGHRNLTADGYVDLTPQNASSHKGIYLLDPTDVTIYGNTTSVFDNAGLVAGYSFDEGAGTSAADSSGNGNTGTLTNGPTWSSTIAPTPQANSHSLSFDGSDDYVNVPDNTSLQITSPLTVSAWIKPGMLTNYSPFAVQKVQKLNFRGA